MDVYMVTSPDITSSASLHFICAPYLCLHLLSNKWTNIECIPYGRMVILKKRGVCLVAWRNVTRPKDQGDLGIIDIKAHNTALLLKLLHKFYNNHDLPWVQLTWKQLYRNQNKAHVSVVPRVPSGGEVLLD